MNIIEAIKTGKPIKRASKVNQRFHPYEDSIRWFYDREDLLAEDWIVQPETPAQEHDASHVRTEETRNCDGCKKDPDLG